MSAPRLRRTTLDRDKHGIVGKRPPTQRALVTLAREILDQETILAMFREAGAECWVEDSEDEQAHP